MAELRSFDPTWRDKIAAFLMGNERPSPARRTFVEGMMGSTGLGTTGMGLVDFTPPGPVLGAQDAAKAGDYRGAAVQAMFLGPAARIADKAMLATAEKMAAKGASRDEIWNATGWFKGADDKWRFEIDDSQIPTKFVPNEPNLFDYPKVSDYVPHKDLFKAYPALDELRLAPELSPSSLGTFDAEQRVMTLRPIETPNFTPAAGRESKSTVLHELQHGVQDAENFARGGSPTEFMQQKDAELARDALWFRREIDSRNFSKDADWIAKENAVVDDFHKMGVADWLPSQEVRQVARDTFNNPNPQLEEVVRLYGLDKRTTPYTSRELYHRLAGEVEARNVQKRMDMTPDQRRATPPWLTQDVPDNQQIVRYLLGK